MGKSDFNESNVRANFKNHWVGWLDTIQPGLGGTVGVCDTQVLIDGKLVPIELKWCELRNGLILPKRIRPDQISWHRRFNDAGGDSFFLMGADDSCVFIAPALYAINQRKKGLRESAFCARIPTVGTKLFFTESLRAFVRRW